MRAQIGEEIVARYRLLPRAGAIDAPDGADAPCIGNIGLHALDRGDFGAHRIIALAILAKADRAHEALIVEAEPLASCGDRKGGRGITHLRAGEGDIVRIGDQRPRRGAMEAIEIVVDDGEVALTLNQRRPAPRLCLNPGADAQGERVGVGGKPVLIDIFIAEAGFAEGLQHHLLGMRRRGWRERQQQDDGAVHV